MSAKFIYTPEQHAKLVCASVLHYGIGTTTRVGEGSCAQTLIQHFCKGVCCVRPHMLPVSNTNNYQLLIDVIVTCVRLSDYPTQLAKLPYVCAPQTLITYVRMAHPSHHTCTSSPRKTPPYLGM